MSVNTHNKIWELELDLLRGEIPSTVFTDLPVMKSLQCGEYDKILESCLVKDIFFIQEDFIYEASKPLDCLTNSVNSYLSKHVSIQEQFEVLCVGIASMNSFIQSNWTGPEFSFPKSLTELLTPFVKKFFSEDLLNKDLNECIHLLLSEDGEEIFASVCNPELLVVAKAIFGSNLSELRTPDWWLFRSTFIHQQILDELSQTLQELLYRLAESIQNFTWICDSKYLQVLSVLEVARIHLHYGRISAADKALNKSLVLLNMAVNLTGALGKRTYYQNKDLAQLTLDIKIERSTEVENDCYFEVSKETDFPKDVLLNDDVRMPQVTFTNPQDGDFPNLFSIEQAALLTLYFFKKKSQARDHLLNEELMPFINCLLSCPKVWAFQFSVLYLRTRVECEHRRTVERALLQLQTLMEPDSCKTPINDRLNLFYCSYAPPSFVVESECATVLVSLGSYQSALDIFLKLQQWDEVIACYHYLKLKHKAAEVIREQLKKGETVKLLCSLGDATDDISCYDRAWELSNHRSALAQRNWGMFYFIKKMYSECIDHFKKSLELNSLQIPLWFRLGYATLMEQRWEESATAYRRYCALEPESFEAWNNLAKAYILLGQKHKAYNALQEAIKCNFETWQVWDNLMAVSNDCGDFEEVIHCYHRIIDLKEKHIDEQILTILTSVVVNGVKDCKNQPASVHRKKALELFGRITSKVMGNAVIWQLYAQLTASIDEQTSITRSKTIQYYQKAYTSATQDNSWCRDYESMQNVIKICEKLAEAHLIYVKESASTNEAASSLSSAKFALTNVIAKIHLQMQDMEKSEDGTINNYIISLENTLKTIKEEIEKIKSN